jgi:nucleotide-sensitive chloride channel 1A
MPPTTIHTAPDLESFTALAEHQSQTPATFYNAKPVLHYHATGARALASQDQLSSLPIFSLPADDQSLPDAENKGVVVERVDVYISSESVFRTRQQAI